MILSLFLITSLLAESQAKNIAEPSLAPAFAILEKTQTGKTALAKARAKNLSITLGQTSKTEIVATRVIQGKTEKLEFNIQVIVAVDKSPVFQAIDLAHELVHALNPKANPFDPKLNVVDYILQGIESESGEASAIGQECRVGQELVSIVDEAQAQLIKARCQFVWKTEKDQNQWTQSFYHLGSQYELFASKISSLYSDQTKKLKMLKLIQSKDPMFTSAAAHKPYPLALLEEYIDITQKICSRSRVRRSVASVTSVAQMDERCQSLSSALFSH